MPIPFNFKVVDNPSTVKIQNLERLGEGEFLAWSYNGLYKNLKAGSLPYALVGFRKILGACLDESVQSARVPLTALSQVRLGTIWKDNASHSMAAFEEREFDLDFRSGEWSYLSFWDARKGHRPPYDLSKYPLKYATDGNWYLEFKLKGGGVLVVPCLEFLTQCYGRSSELTRVLTTYLWPEVNTRLFPPIDERDEPESAWKVKIPERLHRDDAIFLAHVKYDPYAREIAKSLHSQIQAQYNRESKTPIFLKVAPWFQGPAELCCQGIPLDDRSFLALRIVGGSDPDGILIERHRDIAGAQDADAGNQGDLDGWRSSAKRLIYPPDIVALTGDEEPDHGASSVEIVNQGFKMMGVPRLVVDRHGEIIPRSYARRRSEAQPKVYSSGEPYGSGKGVGYAGSHTPRTLESYGALLDVWKATDSLKQPHPGLIQSASWFTFADGYQQQGTPQFILLNPIKELEYPTITRNWCYFDAAKSRLRGVMVLRIVSNGSIFHLVEIERRLRHEGEGTEKKEEPYRGLIIEIREGKGFEQWLRKFLSDVRYVRGIVSKLVGRYHFKADTFPHTKRDGYLSGEPAVLNALEKMGITIPAKRT